MDLQRTLQRSAFALLLPACAAALLIPLYPVPRTGLAAHVIGITGALFLLGTSHLLPGLRLSARALSVAVTLLTVSVWLGFLTQWVGAFGGLSRMFVVTAAGRPEGWALLETAIEWLIKGITPLTFIGCAMVLWGLRGQAPQRA